MNGPSGELWVRANWGWQRQMFQLRSRVCIKVSGEHGEVIGASAHVEAAESYLVRYCSADGRAVEAWWAGSALELVQAAPHADTAVAAEGTVAGHGRDISDDEARAVVELRGLLGEAARVIDAAVECARRRGAATAWHEAVHDWSMVLGTIRDELGHGS